jgi:hypothetical protein
MKSEIQTARENFHSKIMNGIIRQRAAKKYGNCYNLSDADSKKSVILGNGIVERMTGNLGSSKIDGQKAGALFERAVFEFVKETFPALDTLRPGSWIFQQKRSDYSKEKLVGVTAFEQYAHLAELEGLLKSYPELSDITGHDYIVKPDVLVARMPEPDEVINAKTFIVDDKSALKTPIREKNNQFPILHASISCKWTMRSDRSQNSRTEALNLIRNRKGPLPHIVVVTMEPTPSRIASIAVGTGDIDCVYHAALYELINSAYDAHDKGDLDKDDYEWLSGMVSSNRLRDISDLPFDLAI